MTGPRRRFLAPEVIQTSAMDCGPAALASLLEGFGIRASVGRLREACQTDVDGTSIDTLEEVAVKLGLEAEQVLTPSDELLLPEAEQLPALIVVRLPDGLTHFVILWRRHGHLVQVMDPGKGRRWMTTAELRRDLYIHEMTVPAASWRAFVGSDDHRPVFLRRFAELGVGPRAAAALLDEALADPGWRGLATLDAAVRLCADLARAGALPRRDRARAVRSLVSGAAGGAVPEVAWAVRAASPAADGTEQVLIRGAVLVRVLGRRPPSTELSRELAAALREPRLRPLRELLKILRADGAAAPILLTMGLVLAALVAVGDVVLWRSLFDLVATLGVAEARLGALVAILVYLLAALLLEAGLWSGAAWLGRHLELRVRAAFLAKIPRLGDRYFQSRLMSDMAGRAHGTHQVRAIPTDLVLAVRLALQIVATVVGLGWASGRWLAAVAAGAAALVPAFVSLPALAERDMRARLHLSTIGRYTLDAMLGLGPVRAHRAERLLQQSQEGLVVEWRHALLELWALATRRDLVQLALGFAVAAWMVTAQLRGGDGGRVLLVAYWALGLPFLATALSGSILSVLGDRNSAGRLLEPLGAPTEEPGAADGAPARRGAAALAFRDVGVRAAGHAILAGVDLDIAPGTHVAIVGRSGAGKSSFLGLLLGWHRAAEGEVTVDGEPLDAGPGLTRVRRETVWVDPAVQLWNRSVLDNLTYGSTLEPDARLDGIIESADLARILARLPQGLQTPLGDGGAGLSGGEGQRVRLGRALFRRGARLVLLDEPFRGLDRGQRRAQLARARAAWAGVTLLCVSHDLEETLAFDRVLVFEGGALVEDGAPTALAATPGSRYAALLEAERHTQEHAWRGGGWRRVRVENGRLSEGPAEPGPAREGGP